VERRDERPVLGLCELPGGIGGFLVGAVDKVYLSPVPANGRDLRQRRLGRHEQVCVAADAAGRPRNGLRVIAPARSHTSGADPLRLRSVRMPAVDPELSPCGTFGLVVYKSTAPHHFRGLGEAGIIEQRTEGPAKYTTLWRVDR